MCSILISQVHFIEPCGHGFCVSCVRQAAEAAVCAGNGQVRCPEDSCQSVFSQAALTMILDPRTIMLLERQELQQALKGYLQRCLTPNCYNSVTHDGVAAEFACSKCGHSRCVMCGAEPFHAGQPCAASSVGKPPATTAVEDVESVALAAYLAANTRECNRCRERVEKASGVSGALDEYHWIALPRSRSQHPS